MPIIQHLAPEAKLLPVIVPPSASAPAVGEAVAEQVEALGRKAVFLGSTDLTHYGPRYRFTPMGSGPEALRWAKEVNDRRVLDLVVGLQADKVVPEAIENHNACGSGAVAATIRACTGDGCRPGPDPAPHHQQRGRPSALWRDGRRCGLRRGGVRQSRRRSRSSP